MTHDSIGLGEDGPTHQPIETLPALRAMPNMLVFRPADGNEVSGAYLAALQHRHNPSTLCLTRQNVPHLVGSSIEGVLKGAYVLQQDSATPQVILVGTGSEVSLAIDAAKLLAAQNIQVSGVYSNLCTILVASSINQLNIFSLSTRLALYRCLHSNSSMNNHSSTN